METNIEELICNINNKVKDSWSNSSTYTLFIDKITFSLYDKNNNIINIDDVSINILLYFCYITDIEKVTVPYKGEECMFNLSDMIVYNNNTHMKYLLVFDMDATIKEHIHVHNTNWYYYDENNIQLTLLDLHTTFQLNMIRYLNMHKTICPIGLFNTTRTYKLYPTKNPDIYLCHNIQTNKCIYIFKLTVDQVNDINNNKVNDNKISVYNGSCDITLIDTIMNVPTLFKDDYTKINNKDITDDIGSEIDIQYHNKDDTCSICLSPLDDISTVICLPECKQHPFHKDCIKQCVDKDCIECPYCRKLYGVKYGNQPAGIMKIYSVDFNLPKFECDTILIVYSFGSGIYLDKTPDTLDIVIYPSDIRLAYLPNNVQGNKCLRLLTIAWNRNLIFNIGLSLTRSHLKDKRIIWNGIHHKTMIKGDYGYPDLSYLDRLEKELELFGIL